MLPHSGKLLILGAGESGTGSAVLGVQKGYSVVVSDSGNISPRYLEELERLGVSVEQGGHGPLADDADLVIKSPGIPDAMPVVRNLFNRGIPVVSEIEFASRFTNAKMICITGTNGKTTTTLLTYHLLKKAGLNVGLGGNVGRSFARQVAEGNHDYYVLELSSFQLDGCFDFKADIAILTNITPDHLDRYDYQLERYIDSKFRIMRNQGPADHFIFCSDDPLTTSRLRGISTTMQLHPFSIRTNEGMSAWLQNDQLTILTDNQTFAMSIHDLALQGKHNIYNSMAAGIAGRILDIRKDVVRESFTDFENIEHRLEFVTSVHGIDFINDSKATNVNSTWYALESMDKPVIWIAGGVDKGNDYSMLADLVGSRVKAIVCMGKDNKKIIEAFTGVVPEIVETGSAEEAVQTAYRMGKKGDAVLLSPACASFDLFDNYEDRGRRFKAAVRSL